LRRRAVGATVTYAKQLMHGKQSEVEFDPACPLFCGCEAAGRGIDTFETPPSTRGVWASSTV